MRLLTGPAGSGKTSVVLERLRDGLRTGDDSVRLLVPTATLAQHLQNLLAREGFVFRRRLIQTLNSFIDGCVPEPPQVPQATLYLIVEQAVKQVRRPEFERVAHMPGFCASIANTIAEFSSAGCDAGRLADALPDTPLGPGFLAVYRETERELERRALALRATRLAAAAERIEREGTGRVREFLLDGFHALPDPELRVIRALSRHAEIMLTGVDFPSEVRQQLFEMGFREEHARRVRGAPAVVLVKAPGIEREVEEIARRILEHARAGRPFREMGIVVRPAESYVPVLRSTLDRFGIPARFYFDSKLEQHGAIRFLSGAIEAMLSGWEHLQTLAALRLAPRFADSNALDRFDHEIREQIPNTGLGILRSMLVKEDGAPYSPGAERLLHKLDSLAAIEEWRMFSLTPKDWAARFQTLRNLFRAEVDDAAGHDFALQWRSQAAALDLFDQTLDEAALALANEHPMPIEPFWRTAKSVLRLQPLRLADARRDVVHVLSAPEARQWVLPIVFVCGMVEKQFPQFHRPDLFFSDAARCALKASGIRVRTAADSEAEERALFDSAITRATMLVTLSYPEFDTRGDRNLPSLYLDGLNLEAQASRAVRPRPRHTLAPPESTIHAPGMLAVLHERNTRITPTSLESYLQCPFQYFSGRTLRLRKPPYRPEQRLDFLTQGNIVHEVLARWWGRPQDPEPLFDEVFARVCDERRIPRNYRSECLRNSMLDDVVAFTKDTRWPHAEFRSAMEQKFEFLLDGQLTVAGKIDRLDIAGDGRAYVVDYKYSNAKNTKARLANENLLQAPLYLMGAEKALGVHPAGMFYIGLKGGISYSGWADGSAAVPHETPPADWLETTSQRVAALAAEIHAGSIAVRPADPAACRHCDFRDVCRVQARQSRGIEEGA